MRAGIVFGVELVLNATRARSRSRSFWFNGYVRATIPRNYPERFRDQPFGAIYAKRLPP